MTVTHLRPSGPPTTTRCATSTCSTGSSAITPSHLKPVSVADLRTGRGQPGDWRTSRRKRPPRSKHLHKQQQQPQHHHQKQQHQHYQQHERIQQLELTLGVTLKFGWHAQVKILLFILNVLLWWIAKCKEKKRSGPRLFTPLEKKYQ